ncbi:MAG: HIT domain-containing protein [Candidatus Micrarchaeota archaeon]|nr:HIT domain-containing protein [Candidatus Micrarchaeota archaeon]
MQNKISSYKIYENEKYIAFLDIYPNIKGQTLVIPKKHLQSYLFDLSDKEISDLMIVSKKVAKLIEKKLKVGRVNMVVEGLAVNHIHTKLYPAIGVKRGFKEFIAKRKINFKKYEGYVTTQLGKKATNKELNKIYRKFVDN